MNNKLIINKLLSGSINEKLRYVVEKSCVVSYSLAKVTL